MEFESEIHEVGALLGQGRPEALERVLRLLGPSVLARLRSRFGPALSHEDREDILSGALLRLWLARDRYDPSRALGAWFYVLARNLAIDLLRKRQHATPTAEIDRIAWRDPSAVRHALGRLSPADRRIVERWAESRGQGPWAAELAQELGMTAGAIRVRRLRIVAKLRALAEGS